MIKKNDSANYGKKVSRQKALKDNNYIHKTFCVDKRPRSAMPRNTLEKSGLEPAAPNSR